VTPLEARDRFAAERVARLATVGADRRPHLVPLVFAVDGDVVVSAVDAKPKRSTALRRLANIRDNPAVALLADGYDDDWTRLWWVRADGDAEVVPHGTDAAVAALALLTAKYPQYVDAPPPGPVVRVVVRRWTGWSAT
jgi:PPOX class probable F420-dependent enzyme